MIPSMSGIETCTLMNTYKERTDVRLSYRTKERMYQAIKKLNERDATKENSQVWTPSHFIRHALDRYASEILKDEGSEGQREVSTRQNNQTLK